MKKWMVVLGIMAIMAMVARAAEVPVPIAKEDSSFYKSGEFSIDLFGAVRTRNFDNERTAAGVGINYFFHEQFGIGLEGFCGDLNGIFVDDSRVHLIYRFPIRRTAPYVFAGGGRNFELDENAVSLGVGVEHRFNPRWGIFSDVRIDKIIDHHAAALGRAGIRFSF
jgi:hypothetical protein